MMKAPPMGCPLHRRWAVALCTAMLLIGLPASLLADDSDLLARESWMDKSYGLTLHPPLGCTMKQEVAGDALLQMAGQPGWIMSVYIRKSTGKLTVGTVVETAINQFALASPHSKIVEQKETTQDNRPAATLVFGVPAGEKTGPWLLTQGFVMIDPQTLAILRMEVTEQNYPGARKLFDAVYRSIKMIDPKVLDTQRREMIGRGAKFLQTLTADKLRAVLTPEQWYRIVESDRDIGYMRITCENAREMGMQGVRVKLQARIEIPQGHIDSLGDFFHCDDASQEIWTLRTTTKATVIQGGRVQGPASATGSETGARSKGKLTLNRSGPTGDDKFSWQLPAEGYLSQVRSQFIGSLLPHDKPQMFGFYWYSANDGKVTLRTEQAIPGGDGTYTVKSTLAPEQTPQVSTYDSSGRLLKRTISSTRAILPASKAELATIWRVPFGGGADNN